MTEQWKLIPDFEPYEVSNFGRVRSRYHTSGKEYRILKPTYHHTGYVLYRLAKNKKYYNRTAHILVATAFIPNPENKPQVNHIDGDKHNNNVENLEWVTASENIQHAFEMGLKKSPTKDIKGKDHYASKPVLQYDLKGNFVKKWFCYSDAARFYNISPSSIINCCAKRIKSVGGYIWIPYTSDSNIEPKIKVEINRKTPKLIHQYSLDGELIHTWHGYKDIANHLGYKEHLICACCNGKSKTSYGYKWVCEYDI